MWLWLVAKGSSECLRIPWRDRRAACTASRWPQSSAESIRRRCASTSAADCSPRRAATAARAATATTIWIAWRGSATSSPRASTSPGSPRFCIWNTAPPNWNPTTATCSPKTPGCAPTSRPAEERDEKPMIHRDDTPLVDEVPAADPAEQRPPVDVRADDEGLDPRCVADLLLPDANCFDLIDQAIIVPLPD